jgi:hypothetical protein
MRLARANLILCVAGAAFADPLLDRITVSKTVPMPGTASLDMAAGSVACPDETVLLTGGAMVLADNGAVPPAVAVVASTPQGNGWTAWAREMSDVPGGNANLIISAVCGITHDSFSPHLRIVQGSATLNRAPAGLDAAQASVDCPSGYIVVGGGASLQNAAGIAPPQAALVRNRPLGNGWYAVAREIVDVPGSSATLQVQAVCADAGSGISAPAAAGATGVFPESSNLDAGAAVASCPAGKTLLGGGADILASNGGLPPTVALMTSEPSSGNGWSAVGREMINATRAPLTLNATAFGQCFSLSGVSGVETVSRSYQLPNTATLLDAVGGEVQCPAGKSMVGGGARILSSNNGLPPTLALTASGPAGNGWAAAARETADANRSVAVLLTVSAVCAVLPP